MSPPQRGRPRIPAVQRRTVKVTVKLTHAEANALRAAAEAQGQTLSDFLARRRSVLDLEPAVDAGGDAP